MYADSPGSVGHPSCCVDAEASFGATPWTALGARWGQPQAAHSIAREGRPMDNRDHSKHGSEVLQSPASGSATVAGTARPSRGDRWRGALTASRFSTGAVAAAALLGGVLGVVGTAALHPGEDRARNSGPHSENGHVWGPGEQQRSDNEAHGGEGQPPGHGPERGLGGRGGQHQAPDTSGHGVQNQKQKPES